MLRRSPGWTLVRAADLPGSQPISPVLPLSSAWFTEYDRAASGTEVHRVKVTGIKDDLERYQSLMTGVGFNLQSAETTFGSGWVGSTEESGSRPTVVAVPVDGSVVELLSYELSGDALLLFAAELKPVGDEEWEAVSS